MKKNRKHVRPGRPPVTLRFTKGKLVGITKGKLADRLDSVTAGTLTPATEEPATAVTSYVIFEHSLKRAENLRKSGADYVGLEAATVPDHVCDAYRAALVLAVSALDAFVRTFVVEKILAKLANVTEPVPSKLKDQAKTLLGIDGLFESARQGNLGSQVEKAFREHFEERSFQGVKNIEDAMRLVGFEDVFHSIALSASVNEDHLKSALSRFTKRRHIIAHCGDFDLTQTPPKQNSVCDEDVKKCIETVSLIANGIKKLT